MSEFKPVEIGGRWDTNTHLTLHKQPDGTYKVLGRPEVYVLVGKPTNPNNYFRRIA